MREIEFEYFLLSQYLPPPSVVSGEVKVPLCQFLVSSSLSVLLISAAQAGQPALVRGTAESYLQIINTQFLSPQLSQKSRHKESY